MKASLMMLTAYAIIAGCLLSACQNRLDRDFDYGSISGSVYSNKFFGASIQLPADWQVQTKEQTDSLHTRSIDKLANGKPALKRVLKASEITSATLLSIYKFKSDTFFDFNPNLSLVAEKIGAFSSTRDGKDYLESARRMLMRSNLHYEVGEPIHQESLGGKNFWILHAAIHNPGVSISQDYYARLTNGFAFSFILTYSNDDEYRELKQIISSLTFSQK